MKYIDADKLLEELDIRRKDCLLARNEFKTDDPELAAFYEGKAKKCAELYYYINSLKQEQPSLPSNINEAAEEFEKHAMEDYDEICVNEDGSESPVLNCDLKDAFKTGAKWMAKQGETVEGYITDEIAYNGIAVILDNEGQFKPGDKVIVQIRKKEE